MRYRSIFLLSSLALGSSVGAFGLACSSNKTLPDDGGTDSGPLDDAMADTKLPEGGKDVIPVPACTTYPIKGACDPVTQNCANGKECNTAVVDGGPVTVCEDPKTGSSPKGGACGTTADCVQGTECIQSRCAAFCCEMGANPDQPCGNSVPEGYIGTCSINVQYVSNCPACPTGRVCNYAQDCKPFKIQPCPGTDACQVEDMAGSAKCNQLFMSPGKMLGQTCLYKNDCADGLLCVGSNPSKCQWACYRGNGPYPASIQTLPAGQGGCPATKTCGGLGGVPAWYGVCSL